jgi:hypothetical protein
LTGVTAHRPSARAQVAETARLRRFQREERALCSYAAVNLKPEHFEDYRDRRLKHRLKNGKTIAPGTVKRELTMLKRVIDYRKRRLGLLVTVLHRKPDIALIIHGGALWDRCHVSFRCHDPEAFRGKLQAPLLGGVFWCNLQRMGLIWEMESDASSERKKGCQSPVRWIERTPTCRACGLGRSERSNRCLAGTAGCCGVP